MMQTGSKPERAIKVGAVRVAIWFNPRTTPEGRQFNSPKVQIARTYRDHANGFKSTSSLDLHDIPKAMLALSKAYAYLVCDDSKKKAVENSFETFQGVSK